jgi:hypothetical protein
MLSRPIRDNGNITRDALKPRRKTDMFRYRLLRSLLMAAVVMVAIPQAANAQAYASKIWSFDVNGGYAFPTGPLGDIAKGGATFGVGFGYAVSDLVGLRIGGDWDLLGGQDLTSPVPPIANPGITAGQGPNITLTHLNGGIDFDFINNPDSKFKFQLYLLGGAVFVNSQKVDFRDPDPEDTGDLGCDGVGGFCLIDWQDTYPEFKGGIRLGFEVGDCTPARARICGEISIFGGGNIMFGNERDTIPITELYPDAEPFGTFVDIPVGINIRINVL